jgi:hypothetical protein
MTLAIMQPYFLPYIGYFQLMAAVDVFVVYDNIKYTKKGWINRNRLLENGKAATFSLPLKNDSDHRHVCERELATDFKPARLLHQLEGAYRHAPHFSDTFPLVERIVNYRETNLFRFLHHSLVRIHEHFGIGADLRVSSGIAIDHTLKSEEKVLALCEAVGARTYVNAIGGMELYSKERFRERGIDLRFIQSKPFEYPQFGNPFVPWLSIVDVMMFNPMQTIRQCLATHRELI